MSVQYPDVFENLYETGLPGMEALTSEDSGACISAQADFSQQHFTVRDSIIRIFDEHCAIKCDSSPGMLLSELCSLLNTLPEFHQERKRLGKNPLQYLLDECMDFIQIRRHRGQSWVFLNILQQGVKETPALDEMPEESGQEEGTSDITVLCDVLIDDGSIQQNTRIQRRFQICRT